MVSQLKSIALAVGGDWDGATTTQDNFSKQCIVVSQLRSIVELAIGNKEEAKETQVVFVSTADDNLQKTPVVGHARGAIAYLAGDSKTGDRAITEANQTTVGTLCLGLLISSWHVGILVGASTSVWLTGVAQFKIEDAKHHKQASMLDGSCLCVGDCVCLSCVDSEPLDHNSNWECCLGHE